MKHYQIKMFLQRVVSRRHYFTDKDYTHAQRVFKELGLKDLGDYHDLYVQSNTLLLAHVFEIFRNKCIEIYAFDPS